MKKLIFEVKIYFLVFTFSLISFSCSDSTSGNDNASFSGKVTLEDQIDHSDVTVSLYRLVELDTALARINLDYPNIGVQISQETEFDHRGQTPIASTTTSADGSWEIKIEEDVYNVVFEKEGFGWKYEYSRSKGTANTKTMSALIDVSSFVNSANITFEADKIYNIPNDILLFNTQNITFELGTTLLFANGASLEVYNDVTISSEGTGNSFIKLLNKEVDERGFGIVFENNTSSINLNRFFVSGLLFGVDIQECENVELTNSYFQKITGSALEVVNSVLSLSNCTFENNDDVQCLIDFGECRIQKSIFLQGDKGLYLNNSEFEIGNNLFAKNITFGIGGEVITNGNISSIRNCKFDNNGIGVWLKQAGSFLEIDHNNFSNNIQSITCESTSYPKVKSNNFFSVSTFHLAMYATGSHGIWDETIQTEDISGTDNWWSTINESAIQGWVRDGLYSGGEEWLGSVVYLPISSEMISKSGIQ